MSGGTACSCVSGGKASSELLDRLPFFAAAFRQTHAAALATIAAQSPESLSEAERFLVRVLAAPATVEGVEMAHFLSAVTFADVAVVPETLCAHAPPTLVAALLRTTHPAPAVVAVREALLVALREIMGAAHEVIQAEVRGAFPGVAW